MDSEDGSTLSDEKRQVLDTLVDEKILYLGPADGPGQGPQGPAGDRQHHPSSEVYSKVQNNEFSDEDLKAYYQQHKDEFTFPAKVHVKRILLRITDERDEAATLAEALRIRKELKKAPHQFKGRPRSTRGALQAPRR